MSGCVAQLVSLRHVVTLQRGRKTPVFLNENSVSSYGTMTNTLQTSVVVGALLRASQREPAACLADNFIFFMRSAKAVILCKTVLLSAIFAGRAFRHVALWARGREAVCRWCVWQLIAQRVVVALPVVCRYHILCPERLLQNIRGTWRGRSKFRMLVAGSTAPSKWSMSDSCCALYNMRETEE